MAENAVAEPPQSVTPEQFDKSPFSSPEFLKGLKDAGFQDSSVETPEPVTPAPAVVAPKAEPKADDKTVTPKPDAKVDEAKTAADALDPDHPDAPLPPDIQRASQKTQSSFKALRASNHAKKLELEKVNPEYSKATKELETARKEMAALKSSAPKESNLAENPEYIRIKAELDEHVNKIRELDVTHDKQFRAFFDGKKQQQIEIAKRAAGDRAESVLKLPPGEYRNEQIELLVAELSPAKGMQLVNAATELERVEMERDNAIKVEASKYEQRQMERTAQEKARQGTIEQAFVSTIETISSESPLYQEREGDEGFNNRLNADKALARQIYLGKLAPEAAAKAAAWAARMPFLVEVYQGEKAAWEAEKTAHAAKVSELEGEILKLRNATPGTGENGGGATVQDTNGATGIPAIMAGIRASGISLG